MSDHSVNTSDAKDEFPELINRVIQQKERIILTRRDNPIAAIVPIEDLYFLQASQSKLDLQEALDSLKEARASGTISLDEFNDKIGQ